MHFLLVKNPPISQQIQKDLFIILLLYKQSYLVSHPSEVELEKWNQENILFLEKPEAEKYDFYGEGALHPPKKISQYNPRSLWVKP